MSRFRERVASFLERHPTFYKGLLLAENGVKKPILKCQGCGQCVMSYTAFTCPMRCPKQMRNGPCGGTRPDGHCEVDPKQPCIWFLIYERSRRLGWQKKLLKYHKPVDRRLQNTSAWCNLMAGRIEGMSFKKDLEE